MSVHEIILMHLEKSWFYEFMYICFFFSQLRFIFDTNLEQK